MSTGSMKASARTVAGVTAAPLVGFWAALASGLLALAWLLTMVLQTVLAPPRSWSGTIDLASNFRPVQMLNFVPSLPLATSFLVLMVCVQQFAPEGRRIWGMLGLVFTVVYSVMASINYLIQFVVVRVSLATGELEGIGLLSHQNSHSIFWALAMSYAYMSLGMLFAAFVFERAGTQAWVRRLFLLVGVTAPLQFAGVIFDLGLIVGLPAGLIWSIATPAACFLLAGVFRSRLHAW